MKNIFAIGKTPHIVYDFFPHEHPYWELVYYTSGTGILRIRDKDYPFKPGDIIIQPPNMVHKEYSKGGYSNIYLMFSCCCLPEFEPSVFTDTPAKSFYKILIQLHNEFHYKRNNYISISEALMNVLYQYIMSWQKEDNCNYYVDKFINILISNLSNSSFQITDALNQIPFTSDHFRRMFKKEALKTPIKYLEYIRIDYAKQLMKNKTLKIKEISILSGFNDPYYFSRVFKKNTGKSPSAYLNELDSTM